MIRKFSGLKTIYLMILSVFLYFDIQHLDMLGYPYYQVVDKYFGNSMILIYVMLFLLYVTELSNKKKKRDQYSVLTFGIYPLFLAIAILYFGYYFGIFAKAPIKNLEYEFIKTTVFDLELGLFTSYLCSFVILAKNEINQYIGFAVAGIYILSYLVYFVKHTLWEVLKNKSIERKIQKENDRLERENLEKIRIKEEQEKIEIERIKQKVMEDERKIREAVERERENNLKFQKFAEANKNMTDENEIANLEEVANTENLEEEKIDEDTFYEMNIDRNSQESAENSETEEEVHFLENYPLFKEAIESEEKGDK